MRKNMHTYESISAVQLISQIYNTSFMKVIAGFVNEKNGNEKKSLEDSRDEMIMIISSL